MASALTGYPPNPGDNVYVPLGCGDVITMFVSGDAKNLPTYATCPAHGSQVIATAAVQFLPIIVDGTSVARA